MVAVSSQGNTAVQHSIRRQSDHGAAIGSPKLKGSLAGFAVRTGEAAARRTRLELASHALQQHVKSNVMTYRARVAPNGLTGSPTRAGGTRMSGLAVGVGGRSHHAPFVRTRG